MALTETAKSRIESYKQDIEFYKKLIEQEKTSKRNDAAEYAKEIISTKDKSS